MDVVIAVSIYISNWLNTDLFYCFTTFLGKFFTPVRNAALEFYKVIVNISLEMQTN